MRIIKCRSMINSPLYLRFKREKKKDVLVSILCVQITVQVPKIGVLALETVRGG